jgi:hypothetical protein
MTKLPWGVKFCDLEWAVKGVTKLHNGWVTSSPRQINIFQGLNGHNDQNWPYQLLFPIFIQLPTRKNVHLMNRFIWDFSGLYKKPDNVTRFDGTLVTLIWCDHWLCCPSMAASLGSASTMYKPAASSPFSGCFTRLRADLISHSSSVPVSRLLQILLPASQMTELAAGGGALWRACNLTSFTPCLTGPVDYPFASCHEGPRFKSPRGYLCETGILMLALSRYNAFKIVYS